MGAKGQPKTGGRKKGVPNNPQPEGFKEAALAMVPKVMKKIEKLEKVDDGAHTYTYSITDSPLPVANYTATIKVSGEGENSTIEWSSDFEPIGGASQEDAMKAVQDIYQAGFDNLKKVFGG